MQSVPRIKPLYGFRRFGIKPKVGILPSLKAPVVILCSCMEKKKYYISSRFLPLFCTMKKTIIWVCQIILNNMRVFHICTTLMRKYCFDEHMVLFRPSMYTWITFPSVAHSSQNYESHDLSALAARVHITHKAQRSAHACNQVSDVSSCLVASDAQFVQSELYIYWLRSTNSH